MSFIHGMLDIAGGVMLIWLCVRELRRILAEPPERPIDVWTNKRKARYRFRATPMQPRKFDVEERA